MYLLVNSVKVEQKRGVVQKFIWGSRNSHVQETARPLTNFEDGSLQILTVHNGKKIINLGMRD